MHFEDSPTPSCRPFPVSLKRSFLGLWLVAVAIWVNPGGKTFAQVPEKKPLTHQVYDGWNEISGTALSRNGAWISFEINPFTGDGQLVFRQTGANGTRSIPRGKGARMAPSSDFAAFRLPPPADSLRKAKVKKWKEEDMPKDSLGILFLKTDSVWKTERVRNFKIPDREGDWIAYLLEKKLAPKDTAKKDSSAIQPPAKVEKAKDKKPSGKGKKDEPSELVFHHPVTGFKTSFEQVTEYEVAGKGELLAFIRLKTDSVDSCYVYGFKPHSHQKSLLFSGQGTARNLAVDEDGKQVGFLFSGDTSSVKRFALYLWREGREKATNRVDSTTAGFPRHWLPSEHADLDFSADGSKLYFGTAPRPVPEPKDTLLDEEKVRVDILNWKDDRLQPQQLKDLEKDKKKIYQAVLWTETGLALQLADTLVPVLRLPFKGNGSLALGTSDLPYLRETSWMGTGASDYFLVDLRTGKREKFLSGWFSNVAISPGQKFISWYSLKESQWYARETGKAQARCISRDLPFPLADEQHDTPDEPNAYGSAGYSDGDTWLLIQDRYDLWACDPSGRKKSWCLTVQAGRKSGYRFSLPQLDPDRNSLTLDQELLLEALQDSTKETAYFGLKPGVAPALLFGGPFDLSTPTKAKNADLFFFTRQSVSEFPDVWISDRNFQNPEKITRANPQQDLYIWSRVEMQHWTSADGKSLSGLLYQPEKLIPGKKYPMLVYFYERGSQQMFSYYALRPSRSIINPTWYASNGYYVFIPDIVYETGNPGESAFKAIVSGTLAMVDRHPEIERERIGLQGQSWGGYQVAYLVTRTNLFRAAMAGAPVSNMTSAYGGIRWESGVNRVFQYERGQSRIGGSLWERPMSYLENSPLFAANKVQTPLLIMSNDNDGAVPWYQGIELFVALRRLNKPVWLLNYNGDEHNLMRKPNRYDLSIRMSQFFDHFLKDQPAPDWMEKGVPALEKGKRTGLQLLD